VFWFDRVIGKLDNLKLDVGPFLLGLLEINILAACDHHRLSESQVMCTEV
jgi:hypothetical protein